MRRNRFALMLIVAFNIIASGCDANTGIGERNNGDSILIGVEYFNGWWESPNNRWDRFVPDKDWKLEYPDRVPLWEYNSQETMDREIIAASNYGVDFFSILWYYPGNVKKDNNCDDLNAGIDFFMKSPNSGRMKFMVELCNHEPFTIKTDKDWEKCIDVCVNAMKHPGYLRIDGRAVLKIHSGGQFYEDCGADVVRCRQILQRFRQKATEEGVGELLIAVGTYRQKSIGSAHPFVKIGEIEATMQYMSVPLLEELPQREQDYPYEDLTTWAKQIRDIRKTDVLNWVPYFPAGWNSKPCKVRANFSFPTREQWKKGLEEFKRELLATPNFGFPRKDGTTQKAFTIYAWNEFGEGGILAPTVVDQYMKLEVIKEVFEK